MKTGVNTSNCSIVLHKHTQTSSPGSLPDTTVRVRGIIKRLWQVVFVQAALSASVPYSVSLGEFLWETDGQVRKRVPDLRCLWT